MPSSMRRIEPPLTSCHRSKPLTVTHWHIRSEVRTRSANQVCEFEVVANYLSQLCHSLVKTLLNIRAGTVPTGRRFMACPR